MKIALWLILSAVAQEERSEAERFDEALRPPAVASVELTMWPYARPLPELASPAGLQLLERFAAKPGELGLRTPLERALFQGKLWSFFDAQVRSWTWIDPKTADAPRGVGPPAKPVQAKPVKALAAAAALLRSLALSDEERTGLPDTYAKTVESKVYPAEFDPERPAAPFLPADLWDVDGPWVHLGNSKDFPVANRHVAYFGGRSSFHILLRVPAGRAAALELVGRMSTYDGLRPEAAPELPAGTQVALVERVFLLTPDRAIAASPLTEAVELRVHLQPAKRFGGYRSDNVQAIHRFRLRHDLLLKGDPAPLRVRGTGEEDWEPVVQLVETGRAGPWNARGSSLVHCHNCHSSPQAKGLGIFELRSTFKAKAGELVAVPAATEVERIRRWKERDFTWTELRAVWK